MTANDTKLLSWIATQPTLGKKQLEMLAFFQAHPTIKFSDRNLAYNLKKPINCITNRRGELLNYGLIVDAGVIFDGVTKRNVHVWKAKI